MLNSDGSRGLVEDEIERETCKMTSEVGKCLFCSFEVVCQQVGITI